MPARVKIAIIKSLNFQGRVEQFSNVYTGEVPSLGEADLNAAINLLVAAERQCHTAAVTFVRAQCWNISGVPNIMQIVRELEGTGTAAGGAAMYRECAVLVKWPLPRKQGLTRSFTRRLSKWLHTGGSVGGYDVSGASPNSQPGAGSPLRNYIDQVTESGSIWALTNEDGVRPSGPARTADYLEHRQFPRGRKEGIL